MSKYIVTFKGKTQQFAFTVEYNLEGLLKAIEVLDQEGHSGESIEWCKARIPAFENGLTEIGLIAAVEEVPQDLTFPAFWEAYGNKVNRERAQRFWAALNNTDRIAALRCIPKYHRYLKAKSNIEQKYPDTWIKNKCWNDSYIIK